MQLYRMRICNASQSLTAQAMGKPHALLPTGHPGNGETPRPSVTARPVCNKSHLLGGFSDFTNFAPAREAGTTQAWVRARLGPEIF